MRKSFFTALLVASLFIGTSQSFAAVSYPDVPFDHWSRTYIEKLTNKQVLTGYSSGKFSPEGLVTRAELAKVVVLASGISNPATSSASSFGDVPVGSWAVQFIESAKTNGIIDGYKDGSFRPINFVTRAEIAKMVMIAKKAKKATSVKREAATTFRDIDNNWARDYIAEAKGLGIIGGYADGSFRPGNNITRAEVAKIISLAFADVLGTQTINPDIPKISISTPTSNENYTILSDRITIGGTASDDKEVIEISWVNNVGSKGTIEAKANWTVKDVALKQGLNIITVSATDSNGNVGTDAIRVTYNSDGSGSNDGGDSSSEKTPSLQIELGDIYWDDEQARILAVPFAIINNGSGTALSPRIENAAGDQDKGVSVWSIQQPTGSIAPNETKTIIVKYEVPAEVTKFRYKIDFSCEDVSGDVYKY